MTEQKAHEMLNTLYNVVATKTPATALQHDAWKGYFSELDIYLKDGPDKEPVTPEVAPPAETEASTTPPAQ